MVNLSAEGAQVVLRRNELVESCRAEAKEIQPRITRMPLMGITNLSSSVISAAVRRVRVIRG
jgi:hypothetical protein